jgi:Ca2+-binding RTX toxin-like protein
LGVDSVYGDTGDDLLIATYEQNPFGFDLMDGGEGTDTADFSEFSSAIRIDLAADAPAAWTTDMADLSAGTLRKVASLVSIENLTGGSGSDELSGDDGANLINGGVGNDTIHGGGGNDTLIGGIGIDSVYGDAGDDTLVATYDTNPFGFDLMDGGPGNDTADFSSFKDALRIDLAADAPAALTTDTADLSSGTLRKVAALVSIENLVGGAGNDELSGDGGNNRIVGGGGDDVIHGGDGNDVLFGGYASRADAKGFDGNDVIYGDGGDDLITVLWGNDTVHGGDGNDTLSFAEVKANLTLDLAAGRTTYVEGGTTFDDSGNPNGGFADLNTVTWDGIENLTGGVGNDVLTGDKNDNKLDGGPGTDTAVFHGTRSDYTITLLAGGGIQVADSVAGRDGTDLLTNIETLRFSDGDLTAADLAKAQLYKTQNIDGINVVYADPSTAASGFHFALAGTAATVVFGNDGNDVLDASGTAEYYTMLYGGAGKDTLIAGGNGSYTLDGGPGDDTAVFSGKQSDYTIDGSPAGWPSWATVTDKATGVITWLQRVEHLQFADGTIATPGLPPGGSFNNVLFLDSSNPPTNIGPGYDNVYIDNSHGANPVHLNLAGTNVNFVYGGLGNEVFDASGVTSGIEMWGQWGADVLIGGSGDDTLLGDEWLPGGGNDWLDGGAGNDWLDGGNGDDTFVFRPGSGMDTVYDFDQTYLLPTSQTMVHTNDHDVIRFEGGLFASFDALVASGDMTQSGANVVIKYGAADQITMYNVSLSQLSAKDFVFAVNTPPALSSVAANVAFPGGKQVTLSPNLTVSDPDNRYLASATVTISGGTFNKDGDVLAANTTGTNITASYDSTTETLMLTGSDVLAHYQQVLDSVTFTSTSPNPTHYGSNTTRTVTWVVNDGMTSNNVSTAATTTVNITATPPADTPPVVTVSNLAATHGQIFTVAQLYSARDSDGDDIAQVEFWDTGTGGGHFTLNGVAQGANQGIFVNAAQLSQLSYQSGSGADTLWVRANDGTQWSNWSSSFTVIAPIDAAPVETVANVALNKGQSTIAASSLFTASDPDGDTITKYAFWNTGAGGGHFMLNGVAQGSGQEIDVSAAQLAQLSYQAGSGADTLWVRANDGYVWGAWSQSFGVSPWSDTPPTVMASNLSAAHGQSFAASSLFTATDADGDTITKYAFWDTGNGGGHFMLNGVVQGTSQEIDVTAAQLSQLSYQSGAGADTLWVRANDGTQWSNWSSSFTVTGQADTAPTVTGSNVTAAHGQSFAASSLFTASDPDGDTISKYAFWDTGTGGGHFVLNGVAQGVSQEIDVTAAQLSQLSYQSGSGADTLWVGAYDGMKWGNWSNSFSVTGQPDTAPTVTVSNVTAAHGQSFTASSLFTASDADGDTISKYAFWDAGSGGGHLVLNGVAQGVGQEIDVTAAQLSQLSYQSGSGADTLWVRANDGMQWSGWSSSFSVTAPIDSGPTVTPTNSEIKSFANQNFAVSSLFSYSDPFGSPATQYDFWNTGGGGGHFVLNGTALGANQHNIVSATQLGQLSYQVGTGSDTIWVGANDGTVWGGWSKGFTISDPPAVAAGETITLGSGYAGQVDFLSDTGTLKLENSASFAGTVAGLCGQDAIDFADIGFGGSSTLGYAANSDHSGGTLSVGDGTHMANIALLGSYMASTFAASSDGHGGTLISEAAQASSQTPALTQPHA